MIETETGVETHKPYRGNGHMLASTSYAQVDQIIQTIVARFEASFSNRVVSYYVEGSYADQTAVTTSDLDLTIVFGEQFASIAERELAQQTVMACIQLSTVELDITLAEEIHLRQNADPMFKLGARLFYGEEIRASIPLMPISLWARQRMHAADRLMINVFKRPKPVQPPLAFPEPNSPFYGYTARMMRIADGSHIPTTRNLVRVTGWIASARIAFEAGEYVVRKRDCIPTYRVAIHDEWTALLEEIDQRCRSAWQYRIPATAVEQAELRTILAKTLEFENHFLSCYRHFVLAQLSDPAESARQDAQRILGDTPFEDAAISRALRSLCP